MISTYSTSLSTPSSRKFVPYIPQAPKPRPEFKAQSTSEAKAARPSCSETSSSQVNGLCFHIDDFLMADANASHKSAPSQMVSEHNQPGWDLLGEGGSDQVTEPMNGSSRELSLLVEGDTAQVEPRGMATEYQENERCTAASDEPNSTEQHGYFNINGVHTFSEDNCQASPLAQDKPLLDVSSVMEGLSTTRKRMCPSSVDTVVDPPALLLNVTSELRLEDHRLAKRRRPIERQVEDTMLDPLPTPEVTPRPTSSGLDSYPTVSDEPCPGFLGTRSQSGTGSSAPSSNIVEGENGAHIHRIVEELTQSTEQSISSLQRPEGEPYRKCWNGEARESCEEERVDKVPSRCSTRTSQQRKHNNRQSSNMGRGLSRTSHRQRGESTITTRTSRYTASLQSDPSSEPMVDSVIYSCSPPTSSTKTKNKGIVNRDQRPIASTDCRITDIAHYDVPEGSSIVTTIVHCNEPSLALDVAALYHKLFGNHGKALRTTKLSADSWMLLGYRYNAACTHGSWTRLNTDPMSNSHDEFDQSDNYDDDHEEEEEDEAYRRHAASFDQGFNRENMRCDQYTNKPWSEFDKKRLLLYKAEMAMEWKQIFARFPDRSPGAVRTRWHMLQGGGCATAAT